MLCENDNVKWKTWNGSLPNGAVSINNSYAGGRIDYVAKHRGSSGFYTPSKGPYCYYPLADKEHRASDFEILVNEDDFDMLEWKKGSYGSVPPDSINTSDTDIYVAKNQYGLGKVHCRHKAFFYPWEGKECWTKEYEVLTINRDYQNQTISNVNYIIDERRILNQAPPSIMQQSTVENYSSASAGQSVTLKQTTNVGNTWNMTRLSKTTTGITAQIPMLTGVGVSLTAEQSLQFGEGTSKSTSHEYSVTVNVNVPPKHTGTVLMVGCQTTIDIPYTALLTRTYNNGRTSKTNITGIYRGVQFTNVKAQVQPFKPV